MRMEKFHFISIQQVYTQLEPTDVSVDFSLIVYNILFTTSKHNFWFITSSYSSQFFKNIWHMFRFMLHKSISQTIV